MANYIARAELQLAVPEDYEHLNLSMQQRGYARKITGEDGVIYQLPTGTYFVTDIRAVLEVALHAAVEAADETGKKSAVIVTDWSLRQMEWAGERLVLSGALDRVPKVGTLAVFLALADSLYASQMSALQFWAWQFKWPSIVQCSTGIERARSNFCPCESL